MSNEELSKLRIDKPEIGVRPPKGKAMAWVGGALLLAGLASLLYFTGFLRPAVVVQVASVSQAYPSLSLSLLNASGYVVAQRKAAVASKLTGRLIALLVKEGDPVKADQIVARLESADAEAARDQAAANLAVARARLKVAEADLHEASRTFERVRRLHETGSISGSQFDSAEARYLGSRASVTSMEAGVKAAAATLRSAEVALEYTLIRAPFDAVVLTKDADVGDIVTPLGAAANAKAAVITIADLESLQVEVDVSETSLNQVKAGQPCEIQLDALPDSRFPGEVSAIVPTADRTKASVKVKVRFLDLDPRILPEMSAKVAFLSRPSLPEDQTACLAFPFSALVNGEGGPSVFRVREGRAEKRPVRTGRRFGDLVEALEGVEAGDRVVVAPPEKLRDGSKVRMEGE
jgi:RND family efflux transporter MFP subunit